jgi:erythromycin esterase-like protein
MRNDIASGYQARLRESSALTQKVRSLSLPLQDTDDLDPLLERIGGARLVLLGEASHGTSDYYQWRAEISKRLILEKGFSFIAVEGDWPDCYRLNRYVKGSSGSGRDAFDALETFQRWPTWMWANMEIAEFAEWMRSHNETLPPEKKAGFFGLDVYSLWESLYAVMEFLEKRGDDEGTRLAKEAFHCFEPYDEDVQSYAAATRFISATCEDEAVELLMSIRRNAPEYFEDDPEAYFNAEQNALVLKNGEHYYRMMVRGGSSSWNVRDYHMAETLDRLMKFHGPDAKGIVWEHNTHIGDARATDMARAGMVNVGQLIRERHSNLGVALVGFGSFRGGVIAGREWGAPMMRMPVPPAREGSWEDVFHAAKAENRMLILTDGSSAPYVGEEFFPARGHRAIGVVYDPAYEAFGNYASTVLPRRYDAFLYIDESEALHPLRMPVQEPRELPETFPTGL